MLKHLYIALFWLSSLGAMAAHLVGGEITYTCSGNNNYQIRLRIYRDCNSSGAPFDPQAAITIFNSAGVIVQSLSVPHGAIRQLPTTVNNPCLQSPPNVCTEYTDYFTTINLPPIAGGYTITHQRCCRNNTINNIPNPGGWGNTYTVSIPSNDACNNAPTFTSEPPIVLCLDDPQWIDSSVNETDGDSIYYSLCSPLHGGGQDQPPTGGGCLTCPAPDPAGAPPYTPIPFSGGQSATNPIPSSPQVTINPNTGIITGTPTTVGQYVFAVCVEEWRNGVLLSTVRRDYQFNVTNCQSNVRADLLSQIAIPASICSGTTINFEEDALNATYYFWDFGDPNTTSDTSRLANPTYTYSDTGTFTVMLIANPGYPCADTAYRTFEVRYPVNFNVSYEESACFDQQALPFTLTGDFSNDAIFTWTFPPEANIQTSSVQNPPPITFSQVGTYYFEITVEDFGCSRTFGDSVTISDRPIFSADPPPPSTCAPYTLDINHSAISTVTVYYEWVFGDGNTSTDPNPMHVYDAPGVYSGYLVMYTTRGCADTARYDFQFEVFPSPDVELIVTPTKTTIFEPYVNVEVVGIENDESFVLYMGDGSSYPNRTNVSHRYSDTGWFDIRVEVANSFGCSIENIVPFRVAPIPLIYTPDAFTPNGDGVNDEFRSFSSGYSQFSLEIFDRWGNSLFYSNDSYEWWDGNMPNGDPCPQGVYVWIVKFRSTEGEYIEEKGTVTLLR